MEAEPGRTAFAGSNPAKALLSAGTGLALATVGVDPGAGVERFTFGLPELFDGVGLVAVVMGVFGLNEILAQARRGPHGTSRPLGVGRLTPNGDAGTVLSEAERIEAAEAAKRIAYARGDSVG